MTLKSMSTAFAAALALAIAGGQAAAAHDTGTMSVKVTFADLNLRTEDGARQLLQRIHHAAETVCGDRRNDPLERDYLWAPCVDDAMNLAVAKLGNPLVTALNDVAPAARMEAVAKR